MSTSYCSLAKEKSVKDAAFRFLTIALSKGKRRDIEVGNYKVSLVYSTNYSFQVFVEDMVTAEEFTVTSYLQEDSTFVKQEND